MLYRDLKKVANDCLFNPSKPESHQKILLDVGNPTYWVTKATEKLMEAVNYKEGSHAYNLLLQEATQLLILTRAYVNDQAKKPKETRDGSARKNNAVPKAS